MFIKYELNGCWLLLDSIRIKDLVHDTKVKVSQSVFMRPTVTLCMCVCLFVPGEIHAKMRVPALNSDIPLYFEGRGCETIGFDSGGLTVEAVVSVSRLSVCRYQSRHQSKQSA